MSHPFFDALSFPWHHPAAVPAQTALLAAYRQFDSIDRLYKQCAPELPPLSIEWRPDQLWQHALENLTTAGALRRLCELVLKDGAAKVAHKAIQSLVDGTESAAGFQSRRPLANPTSSPALLRLDRTEQQNNLDPAPHSSRRPVLPARETTLVVLGAIGITLLAIVLGPACAVLFGIHISDLSALIVSVALCAFIAGIRLIATRVGATIRRILGRH